MSRLTLPKRYAKSYGTLFKDFANGAADKDGEQGLRTFPRAAEPSDYLDPTHFLSGSSSVHIKVDKTAGNNYYRIKFNAGTIDWTRLQSVDMWVYDGTQTEIHTTGLSDLNVNFILGTETPFTRSNYYIFKAGSSETNPPAREKLNGWKLIRMPFVYDDSAAGGAAITDVGTVVGDFSDVTYMEIEFQGLGATGIAECWLDSIYFNMRSRPKVIWTFDDGGDTDYSEGFPTLTAAGMTGCSFISSSLVGTANKLDLTEMDEMYAAGWEFGNHAVDGTDLTTLSTSDAMERLNTCRDALIAWGYPEAASYVAYPNGASNQALRTAMKADGFVYGRGTRQPSFYPNAIGHPDSESQAGLEELDMCRININTTEYTGGAGSGSDIIDRLKILFAHNGVAAFNVHNIDLSANATAITPTQFGDIVDQIVVFYNQGLFDLPTLTEYVAGQTSPRLTTDRATA